MSRRLLESLCLLPGRRLRVTAFFARRENITNRKKIVEEETEQGSCSNAWGLLVGLCCYVCSVAMAAKTAIYSAVPKIPEKLNSSSSSTTENN